MIGIILAAGMGTRLRPLTNNIPKPLLEIDGITLVERMINNCINENITDFIIVVGYHKNKVKKLAEELERKYQINIKIIENNDYDKTNTSVSTYLASKYIEDENLEDFILINGDNVVDPEIIEKIVKTKHSAMVIDNYKKLNEESFKIILNNDIGIVCEIEDIGKDIDIESSSGEFIGVSKVKKEDVSLFNEILNRLILKDKQNYYDYAYKKLSKLSQIIFVPTNGLKWTEIDDLNDWKYANELINNFKQ